jgi:hypothetical protein
MPVNLGGSVIPPLPEPINYVIFKKGCYLVEFKPKDGSEDNPLTGTFRVQQTAAGYLCSGDLYLTEPESNYQNDIPIFPIKDYKFYFFIKRIELETDGLCNIIFELWFNTQILQGLIGMGTIWKKDNDFVAKIPVNPAPNGGSNVITSVTGEVTLEGDSLGEVTITWKSEWLRTAKIELNAQDGLNSDKNKSVPAINENNLGWENVGESIGWKIEKEVSSIKVTNREDNSGFWSAAALHETLIEVRNSGYNPNTEWRYHVLAVSNIEGGAYMGLMYDRLSDDANSAPREGCVIAYNYNENELQCPELNKRKLGECQNLYFHIAVHEIGHCLGLSHNTWKNSYYMNNCLDQIRYYQKNGHGFPDNLTFEFHPDNIKRLNHCPDIVVRPGGINNSSDQSGAADIQDVDNEFDFVVEPSTQTIPLGAPVRLNLTLTCKVEGTNQQRNTDGPASLSMGNGLVSGRVIDNKNGNKIVGTFLPLVHTEETQLKKFIKDEIISYSITLLRCIEGFPFGVPGDKTIEVEVKWPGKRTNRATQQDEYVINRVKKTVSVNIREGVSDKHKKVVNDIIETPDSLLALVIGGGHLDKGIKVLQDALKADEIKYHYYFIEAKRLISDYLKVDKDGNKLDEKLEKSADYITDKTIMSPSELRRAAILLANIKKGNNKMTGKLLTNWEKISKVIISRREEGLGWKDVDGKVNELIEAFFSKNI